MSYPKPGISIGKDVGCKASFQRGLERRRRCTGRCLHLA